MKPELIDAAWCDAHPLPDLGAGADKDARGQGLLVGGSAFVPGALLLSGEAFLRTGAGKVKLATLDRIAVSLGLAFPEAATIALPGDEEGEIASDAFAALALHVDACDALIIGPGMMMRPQTAELVLSILRSGGSRSPALLDAGALTAMTGRGDDLAATGRQIVMTPHHGELAALTKMDKDEIANDPAAAAVHAAKTFGAVVALKAAETFVADDQGHLLHYTSEALGLGTAGSGDVLAGVIGGLIARGLDPLVATGWGVWLHGRAGKAASAKVGPVGFIARELLPMIPELLAPR
jgi:ADP-dependent NAD(P)H-hydrate dehydratase